MLKYLLDDPMPEDEEDEGSEMDCEFISGLMMPSNMPRRVWHEL